MKPLTVEVITYAPTAFYHCQHCEVAFQEMGIGERLRRADAATALPDDLARDFQAWSDWIHRLLERHGPRVRVKLVDAASIEGFVESLRHRVGRYPAVIVDGTEKRSGADFEALDRVIEARLTSTGSATGSA
jgi:hypothetical protein